MSNSTSGDNKVEKQIREIIGLQGPIGIDVFTQYCLYDPKHGYYINQNPIGAEGDFITAPEISQMFGEMIAKWVISCWVNLGSPAKFNLIEMGAGRGTLLKDIIRTLCKFPEITNAIKINIVESNNNLAKIQKETIENSITSEKSLGVFWYQDLNKLFKDNDDCPFIMIGNEFLDCLPIKQFIKTPKGWCEKLVGIGKDDKLTFGLSAPMNISFEKKIKNDDIGAIVEISRPLEAFIENVCLYLKDKKGYALFIDYGYDDYENGDTFQSLYKHEKNSPLKNIGLADLTAHVDFMELARIAFKHEIEYEGPITQAEFLTSLGIKERAQKLASLNPDKTKSILSDLHRLIGEAQMGTLFKAFAFKVI